MQKARQLPPDVLTLRFYRSRRALIIRRAISRLSDCEAGFENLSSHLLSRSARFAFLFPRLFRRSHLDRKIAAPSGIDPLRYRLQPLVERTLLRVVLLAIVAKFSFAFTATSANESSSPRELYTRRIRLSSGVFNFFQRASTRKERLYCSIKKFSSIQI